MSDEVGRLPERLLLSKPSGARVQGRPAVQRPKETKTEVFGYNFMFNTRKLRLTFQRRIADRLAKSLADG